MKGYYTFKLYAFTALWMVPFLLMFVITCAVHAVLVVFNTVDKVCIRCMRHVILAEERLRDKVLQMKK